MNKSLGSSLKSSLKSLPASLKSSLKSPWEFWASLKSSLKYLEVESRVKSQVPMSKSQVESQVFEVRIQWCRFQINGMLQETEYRANKNYCYNWKHVSPDFIVSWKKVFHRNACSWFYPISFKAILNAGKNFRFDIIKWSGTSTEVHGFLLTTFISTVTSCFLLHILLED